MATLSEKECEEIRNTPLPSYRCKICGHKAPAELHLMYGEWDWVCSVACDVQDILDTATQKVKDVRKKKELERKRASQQEGFRASRDSGPNRVIETGSPAVSTFELMDLEMVLEATLEACPDPSAN